MSGKTKIYNQTLIPQRDRVIGVSSCCAILGLRRGLEEGYEGAVGLRPGDTDE